MSLETESKLKGLKLKYAEDVDKRLREKAEKKINLIFCEEKWEDSNSDVSDDSNDSYESDDEICFDGFGGSFGGGFYSHDDAMGFPRYSSEWHHFEDKYLYSSD